MIKAINMRYGLHCKYITHYNTKMLVTAKGLNKKTQLSSLCSDQYSGINIAVASVLVVYAVNLTTYLIRA